MERLQRLDAAALTPIVRRALRHRAAIPVSWRWSDVPYAGFRYWRRIMRVDGTARVRDRIVPWGAVVKILTPPPPSAVGSGRAPAGAWDREARAYHNGFLRRLPGGLCAPRLLHLHRADSGAVWLWLEHLEDAFGGRWPLAHFGVAARHLGRFNGAYLTERQVPAYRWLQQDWGASHSEPELLPDARRELDRHLAHPEVRAVFPPAEGERMRRLLDEQPLLLDQLARRPQTLCHHDASSANLFARRLAHSGPPASGGAGEGAGGGGDAGDSWQTVAIDWEDLGPGPPGAEVATLVFGSLRRGAFPVRRADALARTALGHYAQGLRDAGWHGDPQALYLEYAAAVALRWFVVPGTLRLLAGAPAPGGTAPGAPGPARQNVALLRQRIPLLRFVLDRADEARRNRLPGYVVRRIGGQMT